MIVNPFAHAWSFSNLSKSQRRAWEDVDDAIASIQRGHGQISDALKNDDEFLLAYRDYVKQMIRAIRAGLIDHPGVQEFIEKRRALGNRETLRRARSGVEKGIMKQWTIEDINLRHEIITLIEEYQKQYDKRLTQLRARQLLIARGTLRKMSPQGFNKLLNRLLLIDYFRCSWRDRLAAQSRQPDLSKISM